MRNNEATVQQALLLLKKHRHLLTRQQIQTIKGQALAGDPSGAMRGLRKLLEQKRHNETEAAQ